jgi:hypothetical protein
VLRRQPLVRPVQPPSTNWSLGLLELRNAMSFLKRSFQPA